LIKGQWKYIEPGNGLKINANTNTELGNAPQPQLYNLADTIGERHNVAADHPEIVEELSALLKKIRSRRPHPTPIE
jgi:arylsulfatase A-like enzyme